MTDDRLQHGLARPARAAVAATAVVAVLAVMVGLLASVRDPGGGTAPSATTCGPPDAPPTSTTASATTIPSTAPSTAPSTTTTTAVPTTTTTAPVEALRVGSVGPGVRSLEQRLADLRVWLPTIDDVYDDDTAHAVVVLQKLAGVTPDGVVGPETLAAIADARVPAARSASGHVVEVDLTRQVMLVVDGGAVSAVLDVSTGANGRTPEGQYAIYREIDGYHRGSLGVLYRPKYVHGGIAIHGYPSVPPYPASHGCVRVTNAEMDWLWASGAVPVGTPVWIYR